VLREVVEGLRMYLDYMIDEKTKDMGPKYKHKVRHIKRQYRLVFDKIYELAELKRD